MNKIMMSLHDFEVCMVALEQTEKSWNQALAVMQDYDKSSEGYPAVDRKTLELLIKSVQETKEKVSKILSMEPNPVSNETFDKIKHIVEAES